MLLALAKDRYRISVPKQTTFVLYPRACHWQTHKNYACCYYRYHTPDFTTCAMYCDQPVRATGGTSMWSFASLVFSQWQRTYGTLGIFLVVSRRYMQLFRAFYGMIWSQGRWIEYRSRQSSCDSQIHHLQHFENLTNDRVWIALRYGKFVSCVYRHPTAITRSSIQVLTWCFPATKSMYEEMMSCKSPAHSGPRGHCIQYGCMNTANKVGTTFNMAAWTPWTKFYQHEDCVHSTAALDTVKCGCLNT
jgi:hypothetical protein